MIIGIMYAREIRLVSELSLKAPATSYTQFRHMEPLHREV